MPQPDAGIADAGIPDAGIPDAGIADAGIPDAGIPDAGIPDAGIPDAGIPDAGTESPATLTVHSDWWDFTTDLGAMQGITVLLGDGSRFRQPLGRDGIARFDDPAITGPQDITIVMVGERDVVASTTLAVEGSEVWIRSGFGLLGGELPSTVQATLTGQVTNLAGIPAFVRVVGKGFAGNTYTDADGVFSVIVRGEVPGKVALSASSLTGDVESVGMLRGITVGGGRTVSNLVIPLDHRMDQKLPVALTNLQPYGGEADVSATFMLGSESLITSSIRGATPIGVPAMARTPPFDTVDVRLAVTAGSDERIASGRVVVNTPLASAGVTSVALPTPVTLTSPSPGTLDAPGSGPRSGLTLRWGADPAAHGVTVRLLSQEDGPKLIWYVTSPATSGSFTLFPLPAEVTPLRELTAGRYALLWSSRFLGAGKGYPDFYKEAAAANGPDAWSTNAFGLADLRD
ncbi:hypothetical protein D7X96_19800 [Corallococcus interemptor]|uniref:Uncharacterized protein n=2 Tax=Corallococcus interemptor TaxID=2316720 RepID=A0A3A8QVP6_9BACT|nr:hypothetical protein D7X96_19800 [Corallococcus interemptor]